MFNYDKYITNSLIITKYFNKTYQPKDKCLLLTARFPKGDNLNINRTHPLCNLSERIQILGHPHIICITSVDNRIICCQIFCNLLINSAFEQIFNVMQLILVKLSGILSKHIESKKFHDICLSYYFKRLCGENCI
jgi:hypothetical protein